MDDFTRICTIFAVILFIIVVRRGPWEIRVKPYSKKDWKRVGRRSRRKGKQRGNTEQNFLGKE